MVLELRDQLMPGGRSPYLAFCDWLMATVPAYPNKPSDKMSLECVKCALEENRLDLLTHWLSQDRYIQQILVSPHTDTE